MNRNTQNQPATNLRSFRRTMGRRSQSRRGSVLIIVVVTVVILALSAYTFTALMQSEYEASKLMTTRIQSKYLVDSGVDYVRLFLTNDRDTIQEKGGLWDNADFLQAVQVVAQASNPENVGRFTIVAPDIDDEGVARGARYGLVDESSKINLNALPFSDNWVPGGAKTLLLTLPEMTEDIADAILDWMDDDDEVREQGTESVYYTSLSPPYECKNGPMDSIEELLLIRGVTPQMVFGLDINRNGVLEDSEINGPLVEAVNPEMMLGWANFLTLYSKESNQTADGLNRVNVNSPDLEQLYEDLTSAVDENWAKFIVNYRQNGPVTPDEDDEVATNSALFEVDFEEEAQFTISQILDLVDAHTTAFDPEDLNDTVIVQSPISSTDATAVTALMTSLTTYEGETIPGRVNIMQAPRQVLLGIPGMSEDLVDQIISVRKEEPDPNFWDDHRRFETWLLVEGRVSLEQMRILLPFVCCGGSVYSAEVVGYFGDGVATSRASVVLDTTVPIPRILSWRDKSHVEGAYSVETLGVDLSQ